MIRAFLILLTVLLLLEALLRWGVGLGDPPLARLDADTEYELVGPRSYMRWHNRIEINQYGMRADEISPEPAQSERRILLIGDSVIYGGHFLDQTETISAQAVQTLSNDPELAGCALSVLPVAVSSWGPENQRAYLAREGVFGATLIGLVVSSHDLTDVPTGGQHILPYRTQAPVSAISDAVEAVWERLFPPAAPMAPMSYEDRADVGLAALDAMQAQARSEGAAFVLIYHPTISERQGQPHPARDAFQGWAAQGRVPFVDLGDVPVDPAGYRDNIHPDADGAFQIATALAGVFAPEIRPCPGDGG